MYYIFCDELSGLHGKKVQRCFSIWISDVYQGRLKRLKNVSLMPNRLSTHTCVTLISLWWCVSASNKGTEKDILNINPGFVTIEASASQSIKRDWCLLGQQSNKSDELTPCRLVGFSNYLGKNKAGFFVEIRTFVGFLSSNINFIFDHCLKNQQQYFIFVSIASSNDLSFMVVSSQS